MGRQQDERGEEAGRGGTGRMVVAGQGQDERSGGIEIDGQA